jgi:ArsR family transcriptional regulator
MIPSNLYLFQIALLLKNKEMIPTEIAEHFNFTLPALSSHLRILKDTDLITEIRKVQNRFYSLNRKTTSELVRFFDDMYDYKLSSLKEYIENKESKEEEKIMTGSLEDHKVVSNDEWLEA